MHYSQLVSYAQKILSAFAEFSNEVFTFLETEHDILNYQFFGWELLTFSLLISVIFSVIRSLL